MSNFWNRKDLSSHYIALVVDHTTNLVLYYYAIDKLFPSSYEDSSDIIVGDMDGNVVAISSKTMKVGKNHETFQVSSLQHFIS